MAQEYKPANVQQQQYRGNYQDNELGDPRDLPQSNTDGRPHSRKVTTGSGSTTVAIKTDSTGEKVSADLPAPVGNPSEPTSTPSSSGGSSSGSQPSVPETPITPAQTTIDSSELVTRLTEGMDPVEIERVDKYDKQPMVDLVAQQIEAARQQHNNQIDNATNQGVTELRRAVNDAQAEFAAQQQQIAADEMNALDNAALYAEARGDKGGIGQAQYGSIQNTAAQNRQAVRNAQTKLATDTSRQISDLRAQGEFDKADAMLELTQTYLAELRNIEEFAANYNLNVDQINTAISQWEAEYAKSVQQFITSTEMSIAGMTGTFSDGTPTLEALTRNNQNLAEIAMSLLTSGMSADKLTEAQLAALAGVYGMDAAQIAAYAQLAAASKKSGGGVYPVKPVDENPYIDENGNIIPVGNPGAGTGSDPTGLYDYMEAIAEGWSREEIIDAAVSHGIPREQAEVDYLTALRK